MGATAHGRCGYLHSQNPPIIYRDIKPANVMLLEGTERIKLIDFGIARFHKAGKTHDTEAFGTAGYAPPEQYGKGQTDQRSDSMLWPRPSITCDQARPRAEPVQLAARAPL